MKSLTTYGPEERPSYIAGRRCYPVYADQLQVYAAVSVQLTRETALSPVIPIVVARLEPAPYPWQARHHPKPRRCQQESVLCCVFTVVTAEPWSLDKTTPRFKSGSDVRDDLSTPRD